jgi:hypothetical protein
MEMEYDLASKKVLNLEKKKEKNKKTKKIKGKV